MKKKELLNHKDPMTSPSPFVFDYKKIFVYQDGLLKNYSLLDEKENTLYQCLNFYNEKGLKIKEERVELERMKYEIHYIYDENDNVLEDVSIYPGQKTKTIYQYLYWK